MTALEPLALPAVDGDWEEWLDARCGAALEAAAGLRNELVAQPADQALDLWNRLGIELADIFAVASLIAQ
ncbi:MAG TPA: hypothetical protein VIR30_12410, partial [Nocardioides sp.]